MGPPPDCLCSIVQLVYEPDGTIPTEAFCHSCKSMLVFIGMWLACTHNSIELFLLPASIKHELPVGYVFYPKFDSFLLLFFLVILY